MNTEPATTPQERQVRVTTLAHDADSAALQALLEIGAERLEELLSGEPGTMPAVSPATCDLAASITETLEPQVPDFRVGEPVKLSDDEGEVRGKITDRYLSEDGEWEYQVRLGQPFDQTVPYREAELHAVEGGGGHE